MPLSPFLAAFGSLVVGLTQVGPQTCSVDIQGFTADQQPTVQSYEIECKTIYPDFNPL